MRLRFRLDKFHVVLTFKDSKYGKLFNNFGHYPSYEIESGDDDNNSTITMSTSDQVAG